MARHLFSVAEPKPNTRFKAFFYDDSGSSEFYRDAKGNYWFGDMSEPTYQDKDWFFEAGFMCWEVANKSPCIHLNMIDDIAEGWRLEE